VPGFWNGSPGSWTSLGGGGAVTAVAGDQWVGNANGHAVIWQGPSHTRIDMLAPPGYEPSGLQATTGVWQAGIAADLTLLRVRAAVWHGTPDSAVILHPQGAYDSTALAADGDRQGGWVRFPNAAGAPNPEHAAVWSGTAQSFIDLNPAGALSSLVYGMAAGQLVGAVGPANGGARAALWPSIGAPYIDLNPPGIIYAALYATCGDAQVGSASTNQFGTTAGIWFGTPGSFVALNAYLPPGAYAGAVATSVAESNGIFYVGGYAYSAATGRQEAILWVGIPTPSGAPVLLASALFASRRRRR
jgi:hypothetical protein